MNSKLLVEGAEPRYFSNQYRREWTLSIVEDSVPCLPYKVGRRLKE
jgi:hypothetical protein